MTEQKSKGSNKTPKGTGKLTAQDRHQKGALFKTASLTKPHIKALPVVKNLHVSSRDSVVEVS